VRHSTAPEQLATAKASATIAMNALFGRFIGLFTLIPRSARRLVPAKPVAYPITFPDLPDPVAVVQYW
jgi:hypothetical protein